jgi:AmmeMemoRadiSam system protein A
MTPLPPLQRAALLGIARGAVLAHLGVKPAPALPGEGPLNEPRGAFVSLHVGGELRGCIGTLRATDPLAQVVAHMAVAAATEDPRFPAVTAADLPGLSVSVSVLGPLSPLPDPAELRVGVHGVVVKRGYHRGVLLPEVAVREGWDRETFLKHACLKAGLPARAWQEPGCELEVFEADAFGEDED